MNTKLCYDEHAESPAEAAATLVLEELETARFILTDLIDARTGGGVLSKISRKEYDTLMLRAMDRFLEAVEATR